MDPYERLANAIVEHAVDDYRRYTKALAKLEDKADDTSLGKTRELRYEIKKLERFFCRIGTKYLHTLMGSIYYIGYRRNAYDSKGIFR